MLQHNILCRDSVGQGQEFYVAIEFGLGQGGCRNRIFLCCDRVGQNKENLFAKEDF